MVHWTSPETYFIIVCSWCFVVLILDVLRAYQGLIFASVYTKFDTDLEHHSFKGVAYVFRLVKTRPPMVAAVGGRTGQAQKVRKVVPLFKQTG